MTPQPTPLFDVLLVLFFRHFSARVRSALQVDDIYLRIGEDNAAVYVSMSHGDDSWRWSWTLTPYMEHLVVPAALADELARACVTELERKIREAQDAHADA